MLCHVYTWAWQKNIQKRAKRINKQAVKKVDNYFYLSKANLLIYDLSTVEKSTLLKSMII